MFNPLQSSNDTPPALPPAKCVVEERNTSLGVFKNLILPNGVHCLLFEIPDAHAVTIRISFSVGSMNETAAEHGVAHFLEHLFFGELPGRPAHQELEREIAMRGGMRNACTNNESTAFFVRFPADQARFALQLLTEQMQHPDLSEEAVGRERVIITNEYMRSAANPYSKAQIEIIEWMFPKANLGHFAVGNPDEIGAITPETLKQFHSKHYVAENAVVAIAGSVDALREIAPLLATSFGQVPNKERDVQLRLKPIRCRWEDSGAERIMEYPLPQGGINLSVIMLGVAPEHPDYLLASLVAGILGGSTISRLYLRLREVENLVYSCNAGSSQIGDYGYFEVSTQVESPAIANQVLKIISEEMQLLAELGPTPEELKAFCVNNHMSSMDLKGRDVEICEAAIRSSKMFGRVVPPEDCNRMLAALTPDDVKRFLRERLGKNQALIIAKGNIRKGEIDPGMLEHF